MTIEAKSKKYQDVVQWTIRSIKMQECAALVEGSVGEQLSFLKQHFSEEGLEKIFSRCS